MVKFFGAMARHLSQKSKKDLAIKTIPFVLKWYGNMSLVGNIESQRNIDN